MMTDSRKWLFIVITILALLLIYSLAPVLSPFLVAALIAYLGDPLVDLLQSWKVPRTLGVVIVFVVFSCVILSIILLLAPLLQRQIIIFINRIPQLFTWLQNDLAPWLGQHLDWHLHLDINQLRSQLSQHWQQTGSVISIVLRAITQSSLALIAALANIVLIPVVAFYLMRDWDNLVAKIQDLLPRKNEPAITALVKQCHEVIGAFFRGQLMVMVALGIIYSIGLSIVGLDLALLIGMISGLVSLVPYLGFIVGIVAATVAAYVQFHAWFYVLAVIIVYGIGQVAETACLTPLLVGDKIGLHPVAVIFAILAGGQLFGFVGVLLALPVAAVIMVVIRYWHARYLRSDWYHTGRARE